MDNWVVVTIAAAVVFCITFANIFISWMLNRKIVAERNAFRKKYDKELHYRKSSEVRLGKIGENLAPFLQGWPWSPGGFRFLGNPVDGIQFNKDEIVFVEVKTGGARLSKSQKRFKQLIKDGKVRFATFRISENGTKLAVEESE